MNYFRMPLRECFLNLIFSAPNLPFGKGNDLCRAIEFHPGSTHGDTLGKAGLQRLAIVIGDSIKKTAYRR